MAAKSSANEGAGKTMVPEPVVEDDVQKEIKEIMLTVGGGRICCPRGTRDIQPDQMRVREKAIREIKRVFKLHGAVEIDTPVLERIEILLGQYGDGGKLIYRLRQEAENKEQLALRYDLTVPLARFMVQHKKAFMKRCHIAPVFRRDKPSAGRYRQFYQCDFDIAGNHKSPRMCDAECLQMVKQILTGLAIGPFVIKVNSRKILNGVMSLAGVKSADFRRTCSIVDELDKITWEEAKTKLEKIGHGPATIKTLEKYVNIRGEPDKIVAKLEADLEFMKAAEAKTGLAELKEVFQYTALMGAADVVSFDLSLARGLDYYTGMVLEGFLLDHKKEDSKKEAPKKDETGTKKEDSGKKTGEAEGDEEDQAWAALSDTTDVPAVGAICGGGRYDDLVATIKHRFSGKAGPPPAKDKIDAVGFSIGIERLFSILESKARAAGTVRTNDTQVYVASVGKFDNEKTNVQERLKVVSELWQAGIAAEISYDVNPKARSQAAEASEGQVPLMVWIGSEELKQGVVRVKNMATEKQVDVPRAQLVAKLKEMLATP